MHPFNDRPLIPVKISKTFEKRRYDPDNLLHLIRRSIEWIIPRLVKADARIVYHARYWYVHVASAFPLGHHYRAVLGWQN